MKSFAIGSGKATIWIVVMILVVPLTTFCVNPELSYAQRETSRIGFLSALPRSAMVDRVAAFRQGLRELGYVEGKNIMVEWRYSDGNVDPLPALATELVRLKVEAIVSGGGTVTRIAKQATATIPIVMTQDNDPIGNGFIVSLARPGGNVTGLSRLAPQISGKRFELLKEIVPSLSRLAVFGTSTSPSNAQEFKEVELTAVVLGLQVQYHDVLSLDDIEPAFQAAVRARADAVLIMTSNAITHFQRKEAIELAIKNRLAGNT